MDVRVLNDEVLVANGSLVELRDRDIAELKRLALRNPRRRVRICAHPNTSDLLHEMMIVHTEGAYVRPHKHLAKSESIHVIEGAADFIFFDGQEEIREIIPLGPYGSDRCFFYRLDEPIFHTLLIRSEFFVMHEVTNGPFRRADTIFAPWAPGESNRSEQEAFCNEIDRLVAKVAGCPTRS